MVKNKVFKNASWIIMCRVVQSVCSMVVLMLTARYLGPSNYGLINYASSVVAFVVPIMQLGFNNILVQELVQNPQKGGEIFGTSILMSLCSSVVCIIGVISFVYIVNFGETDTIIVCALYSIILIFQAMELIQYWFQAKYLSKYAAIVSLCAYVVVSIYKIFLLATGKSIYWFAVSNALDCMLISISLLIIYKKIGGGKFKFSLNAASEMFSKSRYYIISGLMITIFAQTDKIMLKLMIDEAATGYYSAAITCAGMTTFVFAAIIDSARPAIFEGQKNSTQAFENSMSRLYCVIIYLSLAQSILMTLFAKPIISILYGSGYAPSIVILQMAVWYTTFSYMGSVRGIWILAMGQQRLLLVINLIGATANVLLNAILIPKFQAVGAAIASVITQFFTNVILGFIIKPIRENNKLMLRGLNINLITKMLKK